jgi:LmbE family N-acetylglucosaminyl deacetylase
VATLVCFHAHPDDESIATGGVMAKAAAEGHTVVLVVATKGEEGEYPDGFLGDGESLEQRRIEETMASAEILGVKAVEWLGYRDSGMDGTPTNDHPDCFWQADVDEAAERLAAILRAYDADVLTIYDSNGNYGHPDHVQVHRVGARAARAAGIGEVYEATMNRDYIKRNIKAMREAAIAAGQEGEIPADTPDEDFEIGVPESEITTRVDVTQWIDRKRASMRAHASQITEQSFFLQMPDDVFAGAFGQEWFIHHGAEPKTPDEWETSII